MYKDALSHFKRADPILYKVALKMEPLELEKSSDYFVSLCREIIGQQLSGRVADVIFERFTNLSPRKTITPSKLLKLSDQTIRDIGTAWAKVRSLKDLAQKVEDGALNLKTIDQLDNEGVVLELTKVKGIGPWTAEMFLMFALARPDVFSPGDLGLKNAVFKLYKLKEKPTPQVLLDISHKWSPFRTYASMILWRSLEL